MRVEDTQRRHMGGRLRAVYWEINIWVQIPYPKPETFSVSKILSLRACGCQGSRHFLYLKPDPCFASNVMLLRHKLDTLSDYKTSTVFVAILLAARCFFVAHATPKPLKRHRKLPSRTHSWVPNADASNRLVCVTVPGSWAFFIQPPWLRAQLQCTSVAQKSPKAYGGTRGAIAALRWHIYNGKCKPRASVGAQWPAARGCCSGAPYRTQQSWRSANYLRELVTHMITGLMHAGAQGRGRGDAITALENRD